MRALLPLTLTYSFTSTTREITYTDHHAIYIVVTDPEDPKFDLEKLIAKWENESK